ncbi:MAG TPA: bifunctional phosphopantothenoylcysteine decarboxylase/phosphopantothenate--cysteine ligase CoaBC [Acidobacteriota bacterium]|nr:bifunctional phosphopantothenoylcysteine decarboxylase/phosphopantothenate--cysteine ligase CoaBC [Acidobacteriota bacterium]
MKVALGVTGCIAAYKAVEVMRGLQKEGASVQVVMTRSATKFVTPLTFEALSTQEVITDMFVRGGNRRIEHIRIAQDIQLLAVVPATANILGKFAHGIADDFLSTLYLSCPAPVLLAPAMNVEMWHNAAVRRNVEILKTRGHHFVDPEPGTLACGMEGEGRLAEVEVIVSAILEAIRPGPSLAGLKVLVTAGPTVEDIDPVRFISNRSSGKMGYAVAQAARRRGAEVFLVSGPTNLEFPPGANAINVRSAAEMKQAVLRLYPEMDIVVKAAAVADYRPMQTVEHKLKKSEKDTVLALTPTEDILGLLGTLKGSQVLVGFAAETENLLGYAKEKIGRKNLDIIVANDVRSGVFGADSATVSIITAGSEIITLRDQPKLSIANRILDMALHVRTSGSAQPHAEEIR